MIVFFIVGCAKSHLGEIKVHNTDKKVHIVIKPIYNSKKLKKLHDCTTHTDENRNYLKNSSYLFTYIYSYSRGDPSAVDRIMVLVKNKKVISVLNLSSTLTYHLPLGILSLSTTIPGLKEVMDAIQHKRNSTVKVQYNKNNFPETVTFKKAGSIGTNEIKIIQYENVSDDYRLNEKKERLKEFNRCYKKWLLRESYSYKLTYDGFRDNEIVSYYTIMVKDNKIVKATDDRNPDYPKKLPIDDSFMTRNKLFHFIENGLKGETCQFTVDYLYEGIVRDTYHYTIRQLCKNDENKSKSFRVRIQLGVYLY